jgi:PhoU domain
VDQLYLDVERRILGLFALQAPVASDLRLLMALQHINLHLERVGDQAVNLAKITKPRPAASGGAYGDVPAIIIRPAGLAPAEASARPAGDAVPTWWAAAGTAGRPRR